MTFIFMQRGATSWGFQIGRLYLYINYRKYWCNRIKYARRSWWWCRYFGLGWDTSDWEGQ